MTKIIVIVLVVLFVVAVVAWMVFRGKNKPKSKNTYSFPGQASRPETESSINTRASQCDGSPTAESDDVSPAESDDVSPAESDDVSPAESDDVSPAVNASSTEHGKEIDTRNSVALYMSGTFNPIHIGHLQMVKLALNHLKVNNIKVHKIIFGAASQGYLLSKVENENAETAEHNKKHPRDLRLPRTAFSEDERLNMVRTAMNSFDWGDQKIQLSIDNQELRESKDHPVVVRDLNQKEKVILVAGQDLAERMTKVWNQYKTPVIVIRRTTDKQSEIPSAFYSSEVDRIVIDGDNLTEGVSSTEIAKTIGGSTHLPRSIQDLYAEYLEKHKSNDREWIQYEKLKNNSQKTLGLYSKTTKKKINKCKSVNGKIGNLFSFFLSNI